MRILLDNGSGRGILGRRRQRCGVFARKTPPPPPPDPSTAPPPITVPMGTVLSVRLTQEIDVDATQTGMTFKGAPAAIRS